MMLLFYVLLALYFMARGAREAGFWASSPTVEGVLMLLAGLFLLLGQILPL